MNKEENAGSSTSHFKEGSVVNNVLSNQKNHSIVESWWTDYREQIF